MNNGGDRLARGSKSAQFSAGGNKAKTELEWDLTVLTENEFLSKYLGTTRERYHQLLQERERGQA